MLKRLGMQSIRERDAGFKRISYGQSGFSEVYKKETEVARSKAD